MILLFAFASVVVRGIAFNPLQASVVVDVLHAVCSTLFGGVTVDTDCPPASNWSANFACDAGGNLRSLFVYNRNCTNGTLPTQVGLLSLLQTVDMRGSHLGGTLPTQLARCTELTQLLLSDNAFHGTLPPALAALPSLSICAFLTRGGTDKNCFSCPIASVTCAPVLYCNTTCPVFPTPIPTTTTTTVPPSPSPILQTQPVLTSTSVATSTTSSSTTTITTDVGNSPTSKPTYQSRTFLYTINNDTLTTTTTTAAVVAHLEPAVAVARNAALDDAETDTIVVLACVVAIAVPLVILLALRYEYARRRAGGAPCCGTKKLHTETARSGGAADRVLTDVDTDTPRTNDNGRYDDDNDEERDVRFVAGENNYDRVPPHIASVPASSVYGVVHPIIADHYNNGGHLLAQRVANEYEATGAPLDGGNTLERDKDK